MSGIPTNKTSFFHSDYEHTTLPAVYIFVFIIGLGANGWAVRSLLQKWKILGHINVFLLNLEIANFLFLPTLPFLTAYYFMGNKWIFGDAFCKITRFCFNLNLYGSIGFLTCISVYRYLAIVHPMRVMGRITVTFSVAISVVVWLLVSVQSLPDMFYPKTSANNTDTNKTEKCHHTTTTKYVENYLKYSVGWTLTGFVIPLLILLGCYGHVTLVLCRKNTINKVVKQRSLRLLFILILLFSVCYIPYHIFKNLSLYSRVLIKHRMRPKWDEGVFGAHQISRGLVCLNSVLNPLVYLHVMDISAQLQQLLQRFRQTFTRLFVSEYGSVPVEQTVSTTVS
ncbi:P2Y purinoceptor 1-like [Oreochromis niloticus]|uniref:P2Y purinoceptor 1-like n=1 Tax=Oreochromis niloticus TaxID=8128 RepID=UPI0009057391|nr:P2Y purinoceptor 1-like [Oreochromis niloticus]